MSNLRNPISKILYYEIYVGMAKLVAWWHCISFGFTIKGYKIFNGDYGKQITYWLELGDINLLITSALSPSAHDVVSYVDKHGNSVANIAFEVTDIQKTFEHLSDNNAIFNSNQIIEVNAGRASAKIIECKFLDNNQFKFIERTNCSDCFLPGFILLETNQVQKVSGFYSIDHFAIALNNNETKIWAPYISNIFDMEVIQELGKEYFEKLNTGMNMTVLSGKLFDLNFVFVEPLINKSPSQVNFFLDHHYGTGIQHIAFRVENLPKIAHQLIANGINFIKVPPKYYNHLEEVASELNVKELEELNILCEKNENGYLFQIFTESFGDRPTLFYELIERVNQYKGFGEKNIKALFQSLEEQL